MIEEPTSVASLTEILRLNDVHLAVAFGYGAYPGYSIDRLLEVCAVPLCSPELLHGSVPLRGPADLAHHTLLHDDTDYAGHPSWEDWLRQAGAADLDVRRGFRFNHVSLALEAAADGQGVALGLSPLAVKDLASGKLVVPFGPSLPLGRAYYLLRPEGTAQDPRVRLFRDWLVDEAEDSVANH